MATKSRNSTKSVKLTPKASKTSKTRKKATSKPAKSAKASPKPLFKRSATNPYKNGSSYGAIWDAIAASMPAGIERSDLLALAMRASRKDAKHASFDLSVVISPKSSVNGPRHTSARQGYYIDRVDNRILLRTAPATAA